MRKTWKSALSFVLSAAMVLTAGVVTPNVKSDAADDTPWFTAELKNNGAFWGWSATVPSGQEAGATVAVTGPGEYTLRATATNACTPSSSSGGATWVTTDLTSLPADYKVVPKTIKVGSTSYDWSKGALMIEDGKARLNIWNQWNTAATSNPLNGQGFKCAVGDAIEFTFAVEVDATPSPSPTPDPDQPTPVPAWFKAEVANNGGALGWGGSPAEGDTPSVSVTEAGDYTMKVTASAAFTNTAGAMWIATDLTSLPTNYTVVGKTVKVGDQSYDWSKAQLVLEDGKGRLNVWNEWNPDATSNPLADSAIEGAVGDTIEFTFTVEGGDTPTPTPTPKDDPTPTPTPVSDAWFTAEVANNGGFWGWGGGPATDDVASVEVTGTGDYTFKVTASENFASDAGAVWISTNLSAVPTDYTVVGKTVKVNDKSYDWSKANMYNDEGNIRLGVWNQWGVTDDANPLGSDIIEGVAGDAVEITFTVKKNDVNKTTPTPEPPKTVVEGPKKGATFTSGSLKYKVTKAATITGTKRTAGTVTVTGLAKKKATSINVKNTAKKGNASYKVKAIGKKAFQKASKLKKVTLGTAIKTIPASAFNGCKKLTTVKATGVKKIGASAFKGCKALKSVRFAKLSSVKKGAFKGCKKTIKVGGKKAVKKANVKKLKKTGYKKFK